MCMSSLLTLCLFPRFYVDGSILYGAGFILVQQDGRFFSVEDYKPSVDVIETTVDGDGVTLQNDTDINFSGRGGGVMVHPPQGGGGGEISPTNEMLCNDGGHDDETKTTDCFVSKGPTSKQCSCTSKGQDETCQGRQLHVKAILGSTFC